jgi:hypothetical protein
MKTTEPGDPQWDRVIEIAAKLWVDGTYAVELETSPAQQYVDLHWAARQAGRVLGGIAQVHTSRPRGPDGRRVVVTVTYVDPTGHGLQNAEEGLEKLMRMVLEEQGGR